MLLASALVWVLTLTINTRETIDIIVTPETCAHYNGKALSEIEWSINVNGSRVPVDQMSCTQMQIGAVHTPRVLREMVDEHKQKSPIRIMRMGAPHAGQ